MANVNKRGLRRAAQKSKDSGIMESRFGSRRKKGGTLAPILMVALASFVLGAGGVGYVMWQQGQDKPAAIEAPTMGETLPVEAADAPALTASEGEANDQEASSEAVEDATEAVERAVEQQGGLDARLAAAEQRLTRLDLQAQAAASNVARAEGLLIAFATRRALQRDQELGYLADQLRLRFGDNWPNAVRTVIAFSRDPVRLDRLVARLEGLGPQITQSDSSVDAVRASAQFSRNRAI